MARVGKLSRSSLAEILFYAILFLFFFQLIADFVEGIYAFGLLGTSIPPELVSVIVLFSPLLLLATPRGVNARFLVIVGFLVLASRVIEVALPTRGRMIVSGVGVGAFLLFLPSWLWVRARWQEESIALLMGAGLTLGLSFSMLFRAAYSGFDISTVHWYQLIGWLLAIVAALLLLTFTGQDRNRGAEPTPREVAVAGSFGKAIGLSLGLIAVLLLLFFVYTSPNVIARWTGGDYVWIVFTLILETGLFAWFLATRPKWALEMRPVLFWGWNISFVAVLTGLILSHQVPFPADGAAYPLAEPDVTMMHQILLFLTLILYPIILIDFILLNQTLIALRPTMRALAGGFALASFFLLIFILAHVFTTVYDYIPAVGPFFRDKFWLVHLIAGLALILSLTLTDRGAESPDPAVSWWFPGMIGFIGLLTVAGVLLNSARPVERGGGTRTVRILTYNVQQGYSEDGLKNFTGQLELIRSVDADIIGLQESDTNRIAGGNADLVRFFADRLDMYSYYGPKVVAGTFGIALLSRYPIEHPRTFYMHSEGEQTAAISAQVRIGNQTFNLLVTHLGNGGPTNQQEAILREVVGQEPLLMMGDFNFQPGSEPYRLTLQSLDDAWLLKWPAGMDDRGLNPMDRIDHLFVSPGTTVTDIRYLVGPQSDHPALMADIDW